jgi:hypothetical protein
VISESVNSRKSSIRVNELKRVICYQKIANRGAVRSTGSRFTNNA